MTRSRTWIAAAALLCAGAARADFTSAPVYTAYVGLPYVYDVVATGSGEVLITAPNGLPPWLQLEQTGNGTARLAGTPGAGDTGEGILLRSEDTACRVFLIVCYRYQFFDIAIVQNTAPEVVAPGIPDQSAVEGTPFSLDVKSSFADPDGDALSFTATGLPSGFTFSGGVLSGTPTAAHAEGSPYTIGITAADGRGGTVEDSFQLVISALHRADLVMGPISASPSPARPGETVTWTVTVENRGPDASGDAAVTIDLAGNDVTLGSHSCAVEATAGGQRLVCTVAPVASGSSTAVTFGATASAPGDVFVAASVAGLAPIPLDPVAGNERGFSAVNIGEAQAAEPAQRVGDAGLALAAGDLNADGYDDVVVATGQAAPAALHLNIENPTSLHPTLTTAGDARRGLSTQPLALGDAISSTGAALADFDADGDLDAVVAAEAGGARLFVNAGDGALTPGASIGSAGASTRGIAAADVDGDGRSDVVLARAGRNALYLNRGGARFEAGSFTEAPRDSVDAALADLDGDGRPDAVFANGDGNATWHRNTGAGFAAAASLETGATTAVAAGDLDGDGSADLVFGRSAPGPGGLPSNPVYLNDGAGAFTLAAELGASPTVDVQLADVDGDGRLDIVAVNATGAHQLFMNQGGGKFAQHPTLLVARGALAAVAGHFGMRQSTDVVLVGEEGVAVFLNDGRGTLGLGDTGRPVIQLIGAGDMTLEVDQPYQDPGATAVDDVDGTLTPAVDNPVDVKVIGTYVVTYTAKDSAGNAATPVTRTVRVQAREASGGGGGGSVDAMLLALLAFGVVASTGPGWRSRGARRGRFARRGRNMSGRASETRLRKDAGEAQGRSAL